MALRAISLCAGVGGLDLGVAIASPGFRSVVHVEREVSAAAALRASMEAGRLHPAPIWSDVRTFDAGRWRGAVDCVLSGDPCQPNSVAGRRGGADDDRWLLDRVIDIYDQSGAHTLFRENVTGNIDGQLAVAIPALERLGCRVAVGIFSAGEAGASHRRERLFILARRDMANAHGRISGDGYIQCGGEQRFLPQSNGAGGAVDDAEGFGRRKGRAEPTRQQGRCDAASTGGTVADTGCAGSQGRELVRTCDHQRDGSQAHGSVAELRGTCLPRFAPGPSDPRWPAIIECAPTLEPAVGKETAQSIFCELADGLAHRVERLRHCGNGVVPLAAALAWVRMHALLDDGHAGDAVRIADDRGARTDEPALMAALSRSEAA